MDQKLMNLAGVIVKQKFELMEALSGCEFPNVYYVYPRARGDKDKKKGKKIFKYKEKSSFYDRCLTGSCKPFHMKVENEQKHSEDEVCMRCQKECACTYYCLNRTEMKCTYTEIQEKGGGETHDLGFCRDPW